MTVTPPARPRCREEQRRLGLAYPKSNCEECGSLIRVGWRCPHAAAPVTAHPMTAAPEPTREIKAMAERLEAIGPSKGVSAGLSHQLLGEAAAMLRSLARQALAGGAETFQARVQAWLLACFGAEIAADKTERNHRFIEEALELVQSCGTTQSEAHQLVDYVYGRDRGDANQEVGGVMVTLAALCLANGFDMHAAGETELARVWTKVEQIRAKQAAKPKHSPLPATPASPAAPSPDEVERLRGALKPFAELGCGWIGGKEFVDTKSLRVAHIAAARDMLGEEYEDDPDPPRSSLSAPEDAP